MYNFSMKKICIYILTIILVFFNNSIVLAKKNFDNIKSDPFNGTVMPVDLNLPNYFDSINGDKKAKKIFITSYLGKYFKTGIENIGNHPGVDIVLPINTPIRSVANGVVVIANNNRWLNGAGRYVVIRHDNVPYKNNKGEIIYTNLFSAYEHLNYVSVVAGQKVSKGQFIGFSGNTGNSTIPHLHFQIDLPHARYHPIYSRSMEENANSTIHPMKWVYENLNDKDLPPMKVPIITANNTINTNVNKKIITIKMDDIFIDLPTNHPNYKAIKYVTEQGFMRGYEDGSFKPNKYINRLDFWNLLVDISGYEKYQYITRPTDYITKAEAIKMIYFVYNIDFSRYNLIASVIDVHQNNWYYPYIMHALNNGYIDAINSEAKPNSLMNRGDIAELLYRIVK